MNAPAKPLAAPIAQKGVAQMKLFATGLLVAMAFAYFGARELQPEYPALAWVEAFAEAAMVGGLADWFAVTALFRHPLGLPIPHTAIIPKNKDRIGGALANFIKQNFLTPRVSSRRTARRDWLSNRRPTCSRSMGFAANMASASRNTARATSPTSGSFATRSRSGWMSVGPISRRGRVSSVPVITPRRSASLTLGG